MTRRLVEHPKVAEHDRHLSRHGYNWQRGPKKNGAGRGNWGSDADIYDEQDLPIGTTFPDTAVAPGSGRQAGNPGEISVNESSSSREAGAHA